jgi:lipid-binding SYLF domain-containing protein
MRIKLAILGLCLAIAFPLLAQKKEEQRLADSATVMKELTQGDTGLPKSVLNQAMCVLIFPSVKKVAVGIGGSYGQVSDTHQRNKRTTEKAAGTLSGAPATLIFARGRFDFARLC